MSKAPVAELSVSVFNWTAGKKLPWGSQMPDGSVVPHGAVPWPDGTVVLPGGGSIAWEDITLPDGVQLSSILQPGSAVTSPAATMPDGSKPSTEFGSGWWSKDSQYFMEVQSSNEASSLSRPQAGVQVLLATAPQLDSVLSAQIVSLIAPVVRPAPSSLQHPE
jgi:hypothetical protein